MKETEANGGSATLDGRVICLEQGSDKWIIMMSGDKRLYDNNTYCRKGWDENSLGTMSKTETTVTNTSVAKPHEKKSNRNARFYQDPDIQSDSSKLKI